MYKRIGMLTRYFNTGIPSPDGSGAYDSLPFHDSQLGIFSIGPFAHYSTCLPSLALIPFSQPSYSGGEAQGRGKG